MEINIKTNEQATLEYLLSIDEELKNKRDKKRYRLVCPREKWIIYENKKYRIYRRYYFDNELKKHVFLLDEHLKYKNKSHISEDDKNHIYELISKQKMTFNQVIKSLKLDISKSTISRLIKKHKLVYEANFTEPTNNFKNVYIDVDDSFGTVKVGDKGYKFKFKLLHFYQDYKDVDNTGKKRFINDLKVILINKCYMNSFLNFSSTMKEIKKILTKYYGDISKYNLFVSGDGARYIKTIADNLNAKMSIDKWHLIKRIYTIFNASNISKYDWFYHDKKEFKSIKKQYRSKIIKLIKESKIPQAIALLTEFKNKFDFFKTKDINNLILYLKRNKSAIEIWNNKNYFGTYTETYVQQLVKSYFGNYGKCYSLNNFMNLLSANCIVRYLE